MQRKKGGVDKIELGFIRKHCEEGKISLEEIGTSKEELERLKKMPGLTYTRIGEIRFFREGEKGKLIFHSWHYRIHNWFWDAEPWGRKPGDKPYIDHIGSEGVCPPCCQAYQTILVGSDYKTFREKISEKICSCGRHFIEFRPSEGFFSQATLEVFEIIQKRSQ